MLELFFILFIYENHEHMDTHCAHPNNTQNRNREWTTSEPTHYTTVLKHIRSLGGRLEKYGKGSCNFEPDHVNFCTFFWRKLHNLGKQDSETWSRAAPHSNFYREKPRFDILHLGVGVPCTKCWHFTEVWANRRILFELELAEWYA